MSSANLAVAHRANPDPARIAAISAAIALNLAVIVIVSRPITPAQLTAIHQLNPATLIQLIEPPPIVKPPPPVALQPLPHPPIVTHITARPTPVKLPVIVPTRAGLIAVPPVSAPNLLPVSHSLGNASTTAPVEASLAYRASPLHFPSLALRQHMHGTVLLRVLVDATGKPEQVTVEQGSGYALLDRSAREQVLAGWRFQPAIVNGQAVRAWARVPVSFDLRSN